VQLVLGRLVVARLGVLEQCHQQERHDGGRSVDEQLPRIELQECQGRRPHEDQDRKSTRLNSSHRTISYAVFCLKKKKRPQRQIFQSPLQRGSVTLSPAKSACDRTRPQVALNERYVQPTVRRRGA